MGEFANGAFEDDVMKVDHSKGISLYKRRHEGELIFSLPCNSTMKINTDPTPKKWLPSCLAFGLPILQTVLSRARDLRKDPADARQVFYYWHFVILFVFICLGQSACPPHLTCGGGAEDNLEKSILSFNSVNTGAWTKTARLGGKHLNLQSHLAQPWFFLLWVRVSLHWPDWHWSHDPPSQPPRQLGLQLQHKPGFYSLELWVYKYLLLMPARPAFCWKPKPTPTESVSRKAGFEKSNTLQLKFRRFVHSAFYGPICSFTPCSFRQPDRSMSYLALLKVSSALKENRIWRNVSSTAAGLFLNM